MIRNTLINKGTYYGEKEKIIYLFRNIKIPLKFYLIKIVNLDLRNLL